MRYWYWLYLVSHTSHTGHLLLPTSYQFLSLRTLAPVFKEKRDPALRKFFQRHTQHQLIKGVEFSEIFASTARRDQGKPILQLIHNGGHMFKKEHFSTTTLPQDIVRVIDVPDKVCFFKGNNMTVLVKPLHDGYPFCA
jgi:hypothetical protein